MKRKFILLSVVLTFLLVLIPVKADSGWDSSYSSSSSSSSSSWSSSSSSSSYSSSSSGSSSSDSLGSALVGLIIYIVFLVISIKYLPLGSSNKAEPEHVEISEDELKKYLPDYTLETLKKELYDKFVDIQNEWMNFDYENLRKNTSDELFNSYKTDLEVLKLKNGQNIMSDFELLKNKVVSIREVNDIIEIDYYLYTCFFDYVIDTKTEQITRGTLKKKVYNEYIMTFTISKNNKLDKCPSCGAEIVDQNQRVCEYCHTKFDKTNDGIVLSIKQRINK